MKVPEGHNRIDLIFFPNYQHTGNTYHLIYNNISIYIFIFFGSFVFLCV